MSCPLPGCLHVTLLFLSYKSMDEISRSICYWPNFALTAVNGSFTIDFNRSRAKPTLSAFENHTLNMLQTPHTFFYFQGMEFVFSVFHAPWCLGITEGTKEGVQHFFCSGLAVWVTKLFNQSNVKGNHTSSPSEVKTTQGAGRKMGWELPHSLYCHHSAANSLFSSPENSK